MALPITSDLELHLDANTLSGNSNGTAIAIWTDGAMSNDAHQATGSAQPLIFNNHTGANGNSVLFFDGTNDFMTSVGISGTFDKAKIEIFLVVLDNENAAFTPAISWNNRDTTDVAGSIDVRDSDNSNNVVYDIRQESGNTAQNAIATGNPLQNVIVINAHFDAAGNSAVSFNQGSEGTNTGINDSIGDHNQLIVGATENSTAGATGFLSGFIAEIAVYWVRSSGKP